MKRKLLTASFLVMAMLATSGMATAYITGNYSVDGLPSDQKLVETITTAQEFKVYICDSCSPGIKNMDIRNGSVILEGNTSGHYKTLPVDGPGDISYIQLDVVYENISSKNITFQVDNKNFRTRSITTVEENTNTFNVTKAFETYSRDKASVNVYVTPESQNAFVKIQEIRFYTPTTSDNRADDTTSNITALRSVPAQQSFDYLNSWDSQNILIENETVKADGVNATYFTEEINSDGFDRIEFNLSNGSATVKVLNSTGDVVKSGDYMDGNHTIDLKSLNTTEIRLKFMLENGTVIEGLAVYGELYTGGLFGGGGISGGFFSGAPSFIGDILEGVFGMVSNILTSVASIPGAIFEGLTEVIPSL